MSRLLRNILSPARQTPLKGMTREINVRARVIRLTRHWGSVSHGRPRRPLSHAACCLVSHPPPPHHPPFASALYLVGVATAWLLGYGVEIDQNEAEGILEDQGAFGLAPASGFSAVCASRSGPVLSPHITHRCHHSDAINNSWSRAKLHRLCAPVMIRPRLWTLYRRRCNCNCNCASRQTVAFMISKALSSLLARRVAHIVKRRPAICLVQSTKRPVTLRGCSRPG